MLVSHDPRSAAVADRVVQIRDGRVSAENGRAVVNRGGWVRIPELEGTPSVELEPAAHGLVIRIAERAGQPVVQTPPRAGEVVVRTTGLTKMYGETRPCCATSRSRSSRAG